MGNFLDDHHDKIAGLDFSSRSGPQRRLLNQEEERDFSNEGVYLVLYRWWKEAQVDEDRLEGVVFTVSLNSDFDSDIVLHLRKGDDHEESENSEVGSSGRQYALVPEGMWLRALKRCNDFSNAVSLLYEACLADLFPLQVRISVSLEANSLEAKISQKDNVAIFYKKARDIFSSEHNPVHIWDFTGRTTKILINDELNVPYDSPGQSGKEVHLELQVHGLSDSINSNGSDGIISDRCQMACSSHCGSVTMNGSIDKVNPNLTTTDSFRSCSSSAIGSLGLTGLKNLGNTCFMNSAIQCLSHTPKLVDFFMGDYKKEINYENPSGMNGELALTFGDLLRKLWVPGAGPVAPGMFKMKLVIFAPQFSGCGQHDSHELLAFLLDGLHEDLSRVQRMPFLDVKDADGRPDDELAEAYLLNYLACNDSIVVDLFQGQFQSTLICSVCKEVSIKYDPFMFLSLPVPCTTMRAMTLTVLSTDGITLPSTFTIKVPTGGTLKDLIESLSAACSLRDNETLLVAEIFMGRILRLLENPSELLARISDEDQLVAYRLLADDEASPMVVFMHKKIERDCYVVEEIPVGRFFGIPVVAKLASVSCGYDIRREFSKLISPFLMRTEDISNNFDIDDDLDDILENISWGDNVLDDANSLASLVPDAVGYSGTEDDTHLGADFEFCLPATNPMKIVKIKMNKTLPSAVLPGNFTLEVIVLWSDRMIKKYDTCLLSSLSMVSSERTQESASVYGCLEAFLQEEALGTEDMWYCPGCQKSQQATKKLDLWRLPEILVVHLKRFSYSQHSRNKLETFVDFPIEDLDMSTYIINNNSQSSYRYVLYAISCHRGGLGGGHYTAFVRHANDRWYEFDDESVSVASEGAIKTSAAYVLFYRKV